MIDKNEVLRYLGYGGQQLDDSTQELLQEMMDLTVSVSRPKWIYSVFPIEVGQNVKLVGTPFALEGKSIREHLKDCRACALMAVTLGLQFDRKLSLLEKTEETKAVIFDCCGSAYIESVCNKVEDEILDCVQPDYHPFRYSPGYGDLSLDTQRIFQKVLLMDKRVGITLTSSDLMVPMKSVTAIVGFADKQQDTDKCNGCLLKEHCNIRKAGKTCGR